MPTKPQRWPKLADISRNLMYLIVSAQWPTTMFPRVTSLRLDPGNPLLYGANQRNHPHFSSLDSMPSVVPSY